MSKVLKLLFVFLFSYTFSFAYDINDKVVYQKDFENKTIYLPINNYRTLKFDERIKNIQLTNSENIRAEFIENDEMPLMVLKVLGKNIGSESAIITLESSKSIQVNFSIMQNLDSIISLVKLTYPQLIVEQANDTILLKGYVKDYKERDLVIDIFKKAGIKIDEKLVDMIETSTPSKMIRVKLYAVEINNDEGLDLKNNWTLSSKNYFQSEDPDSGLFQNNALDDSDWGQVNNQRIFEVDDAIDGIMTSAVSLTGGLSGAANYLGKYFNAGLVLQYLATEGIANILDETTLITLENKESSFHAGGSIRLKTQTTTAEGVPSSDVEKIDYGLQLDIKAKNIMQDSYIDLEITTSSTKIDWTNTVDDIPSFLENEVITNVLAKDGATIVLGGLVSNQNSNDVEKIPLLGDIPVLGFLFTSKAFKEGKSELVFFITPEIVDPATNDQSTSFINKRKQMLDTSKYRSKDNILEKRITEKETPEEKETSTSENLFKSDTPELTQEEIHKKHVDSILGY